MHGDTVGCSLSLSGFSCITLWAWIWSMFNPKITMSKNVGDCFQKFSWLSKTHQHCHLQEAVHTYIWIRRRFSHTQTFTKYKKNWPCTVFLFLDWKSCRVCAGITKKYNIFVIQWASHRNVLCHNHVNLVWRVMQKWLHHLSISPHVWRSSGCGDGKIHLNALYLTWPGGFVSIGHFGK